MSIDNKCLDIWGVNSPGPMHMDFYRDRCMVDLDPFFKDVFNIRDRAYGSPDFDRCEETDFGLRYNFEKEEFYEAFLGHFRPEEVTNFLDQFWMDKEAPQTESFVDGIRNINENYGRVSLVSRINSYDGRPVLHLTT